MALGHCQQVLDQRKSSTRLEIAEVVPYTKAKDKISDSGNYRGISLLPVPGKVFALVILNRCKDAKKIFHETGNCRSRPLHQSKGQNI